MKKTYILNISILAIILLGLGFGATFVGRWLLTDRYLHKVSVENPISDDTVFVRFTPTTALGKINLVASIFTPHEDYTQIIDTCNKVGYETKITPTSALSYYCDATRYTFSLENGDVVLRTTADTKVPEKIRIAMPPSVKNIEYSYGDFVAHHYPFATASTNESTNTATVSNGVPLKVDYDPFTTGIKDPIKHYLSQNSFFTDPQHLLTTADSLFQRKADLNNDGYDEVLLSDSKRPKDEKGNLLWSVYVGDKDGTYHLPQNNDPLASMAYNPGPGASMYTAAAAASLGNPSLSEERIPISSIVTVKQ